MPVTNSNWIGRVPGVPGVLAQVGIRNAGKNSVRLVSVTPLELEFRVAGNPAEWWVTALDQSVNEIAPVVALDAIRTPLNVHEYGGFYRRDGTGFLFGPAGAPVAFVDARVAPVANDKVSQSFRRRAPVVSAMDHLAPQEQRVLELMAQGFAHKEIAAEMGVAITTVGTYVRRIYDKFHVYTRAQAIAKFQGR
jgi:DNA-binding CsgD family transcriptional regulator